MRYLPLILTVMFVFGATGCYVANRIVETAGWSSYLRWAAWFILLLPATLPLWLIADRYGAGGWAHAVTAITYVSLGLLSILFTFTVVRDLVWLTVRSSHALVGYPASMPGTSDWTQFTGWIIISLAIILTAAGGYNALKFPAWKRLEVPFRDLHPDLEGFRIVHLSDLHLGLFRGSAFLAAVVDEVNRQAPDFVVITGDLSDGSVENLGNEVLPLRDLQGPTLFVTGNHDYYWGADSWVRHLEGLGVQMLLDSSEVFIKGEARLLVVGVSDPTIKTFSPEIPTGLAVATPNPGEADLKLLLAHRPAMGFQAEEFGFDLQLSGHTHGGQFFPWNYVIHLVQPFATGLHRYRKMWIYCSRGTGFWGPPIRLGAPAEITEIRLVQG